MWKYASKRNLIDLKKLGFYRKIGFLRIPTKRGPIFKIQIYVLISRRFCMPSYGIIFDTSWRINFGQKII